MPPLIRSILGAMSLCQLVLLCGSGFWCALLSVWITCSASKDFGSRVQNEEADLSLHPIRSLIPNNDCYLWAQDSITCLALWVRGMTLLLREYVMLHEQLCNNWGRIIKVDIMYLFCWLDQWFMVSDQMNCLGYSDISNLWQDRLTCSYFSCEDTLGENGWN